VPISQAPTPPPPPGYGAAPPIPVPAPSPGLRVFLLVMLVVMAVISGLLTLFGFLGVTGGPPDPGTLALFAMFAVLFALSIAAIVGVARRAAWARVVAIVAGVAISLTCLGLVVGVPILIAAARAPNLAVKPPVPGAAESSISDLIQRSDRTVSGGPPDAVPRYFPNQKRTRLATQFAGYVLLLALGITSLAAISRVIERGLPRTLAYVVVLLSAEILIAWIAASRPTALAVIVSPEAVWWRDQRLHGNVLERRQIASIQRRTFRAQVGRTMSGYWLVDVRGQARFRLSRSTPAAELAQALGVEHLEFPHIIASQAELEGLLPGSTDLARQRPLWKYGIPFAVGVAAVLLNQLT
jgi:hypothetical protein